MSVKFYDASGNLLVGSINLLDSTAGGTNGEVTKAPTSDVLFDALALKAPLASPTFTGTVTLPAVTLGGILGTDIDLYIHQVNTTDKYIGMFGGNAAAAGSGAFFVVGGKTHGSYPGELRVYTPNAAGNGDTQRFVISGLAATAVATWADITHTGIVLSGALNANGQAITGHAQAIADNVLLTVDDASAADDDFARFTAAGIEGITAQTALSTLLAQVLLENDSIKLDPSLSADGKYNGITETGTAGAILAFGDLVYLDGVAANNKWELCDANAVATATMKIGICVLAAAEDAATVILLYGKVRADTAFPALTIGAPVHIGEVAGDVVVAAPTTAGAIVRIIGYGNTADELFFCPDNTYITLV